MIYTLTLLFLSGFVKCEGYYCPYEDLGATSENELLYDYYSDNDGTFWTRKGETGWMSIQDYCSNKADTSLHSDAGEWKCNDSHLLCIWDGSSCQVNRDRLPDCKELCTSVLNNEGPECLGNCPGGQSSNTLYSEYCEPETKDSSESEKTETEQTETNQTEPEHNHHHNHHHRRYRKCRRN